MFRLHAWLAVGLTSARRAFFLSLAVVLLSRSALPPGDFDSQVRALILDREFDFLAWTLRTAGAKLGQSALSEQTYLDTPARKQVVLDFLASVDELNAVRRQIDEVYTDPGIPDAETASTHLRAERDRLNKRLAAIQPLAEAVLQEQIAAVFLEQGFGLGGQLAPPLSLHLSPLPGYLVISPRDRIELKTSFDLVPGFTADDEAAIEQEIEQTFDVSALIVPLGGIGTYPTMVYETADLRFLAEVGAHEWMHNYLTFRPLGVNYEVSPELRTMNETTASIVGKEIGALVIARYYPERVPPPTPTPPPNATPVPTPTPDPNAFDFRHEMRATRVTVDNLLADGKIVEAEVYMEMRRRAFVAHGYSIRRLNQAYFAFHGAYADEPGAPGADPVGPAVKALREQSPSLKAFVDRIAWMTSFDQLEREIAGKGE